MKKIILLLLSLTSNYIFCDEIWPYDACKGKNLNDYCHVSYSGGKNRERIEFDGFCQKRKGSSLLFCLT